MHQRIVSVSLATLITGTLACGVGVAETRATSTPVTACETHHHVLTLASKHGACPAAQRVVDLGGRGPRGRRGPRGLTGQKGDTGAPGPGAKSLLISTLSSQTSPTYAVAGTDLGITLTCSADFGAELDIAGTDTYHVRGALTFHGTNGAQGEISYQPPAGDRVNQTEDGAVLVDFVNQDTNASDHASIGLELGITGSDGQLDSHLLVTDGATVTSIAFNVDANPTDCQGVAQIIPSS
jgi:hypothetical protein